MFLVEYVLQDMKFIKMCDCLDTIKEKWDMPFTVPIFLTDDHELKSLKWAIKVFNLTNSGNMSRTGGATLLIEYCPICGEKLNDE